ncbi:hypothetical protein C8R45DRAFT_928821 [Mycena sanguinolenta]|nr:hypothetical protein C8R45DRAFT_928821 [Mycena sanguinolenta]
MYRPPRNAWAQSHLDATTITESIMGLVPQLLESPDIHIQRLTYWVLGILAYQDRTGKAVSTYTRATSSLSDQEAEIIMKTMLALRRFAGIAVDGEVEEVLKAVSFTSLLSESQGLVLPAIALSTRENNGGN